MNVQGGVVLIIIIVLFIVRQAVDEADIIVANHDLVLADLSLGGALFCLRLSVRFMFLMKAII